MPQTNPLPESVRAAQAAIRAGQPDPAALHDALQRQWDVQERPFTSDLPLVGGLIVALRNAWNNIATRWYVQPLRQQQNEFNSLVVQQLNHLSALSENHATRLADLGDWLVEQDHDNAAYARQVAQFDAHLVQLQRSLDQLQQTLDSRRQQSDGD